MTAIRNNTSPSLSKEDAEKKLDKLRKWGVDNLPMLEVLLDAYCIVDLANNVVDFNVAFTELCGESYRKVVKIGNFCDLVHTESCPTQCPAVQIVASHRPLRLDELKGSSKAYPRLQMILGGIPLFDENKEIIGSLITIRNVSAENELQRKYGESKLQSVTDGLTRIYNKTYAETALLRALKSALREIQSISICMMDVDHFKKVNDTFGHQAGDYVLSMVADLLKAECRDSDLVGRFGGEEFLTILSNSDSRGAKIFAERFRKRVEGTKFVFEGKQIPITVSLGVSTFSETWQPGMNPEKAVKDLINKADTALYFAKQNGRNQSCQYETIPKSAQQAKKPEK